jgi:hypothetical protein
LKARLIGLCAALTFSGCNCFVPVLEGHPRPLHKDAGTDGGAAADAGRSDAGCSSFEQCGWDGGGLCEFQSADAGPSCIGGTCLTECPGRRTCQIEDAGHCLSCSGARTCSPASCLPGPHCVMKVSTSNCLALPVGSTIAITTQADCQQVAEALGTWVDVSFGEAVANFPALGGTCTGLDLFTGVPRMEFSCPGCQFVEEGCE